MGSEGSLLRSQQPTLVRSEPDESNFISLKIGKFVPVLN